MVDRPPPSGRHSREGTREDNPSPQPGPPPLHPSDRPPPPSSLDHRDRHDPRGPLNPHDSHDPRDLRDLRNPRFQDPPPNTSSFFPDYPYPRKRTRPPPFDDFPNIPPDEPYPSEPYRSRRMSMAGPPPPFPGGMAPRMPQHPPTHGPYSHFPGQGSMGMMSGMPPGGGGGFGMFRNGPESDFGFGFDGFGGFYGEGGGMHRKFRRRGWGGGGGWRGGAKGGPYMGRSRAEGNDYNQHFVDTDKRPQNFLRDSQLEDQYEDYPNAKKLVMLKDSIILNCATPPYYLKADLRTLELSGKTFGTKFDVVLIDPPWEEYVRRAPGVGDGTFWKWQEIRDLKIEDVMDSPSFVFLWCGSEEGLEAGRHCLNKWGYRRCEDIVWIKTNKDRKRKYLSAVNQEAQSVLQHTKEHCLMGIKGTVRRSTDGHVIHANVDTDVIVSEEPPLGGAEKPEQMYSIIERFCLGRRRLELFGEDHNIRPGWVTVGNKLSSSNFKPSVYVSHFLNADGMPFTSNIGRPQPGQPNLLPSTEEIEALRPKSPPAHQNQ